MYTADAYAVVHKIADSMIKEFMSSFMITAISCMRPPTTQYLYCCDLEKSIYYKKFFSALQYHDVVVQKLKKIFYFQKPFAKTF